MDNGRVALVATEPDRDDYRRLAESELAATFDLRFVDWRVGMSDEERGLQFDKGLAGATAVVCGPWQTRVPLFDEERWGKAGSLRAIAGTFDFRFDSWIRVDEAQRRGVTLIDTSRSMTPTVAEFAVAMTLNLLRDIPHAIDLVRAGEWKQGGWDTPGFVYGDLTGRRIGLAGFGSINRRYAELVRSFDCDISVCDPFVPISTIEGLGYRQVDSLEELAANCEIFVVGVPPTPATLGLIRADVIRALPTGALFILVTRMAVVDQEALWPRVERGELRAAIDVFSPEPPPADAPFRLYPHALPTPHIAGGADYCHRRCLVTACRDAIAVVEGTDPRYAVTSSDADLYAGKPILPTTST